MKIQTHVQTFERFELRQYSMSTFMEGYGQVPTLLNELFQAVSRNLSLQCSRFSATGAVSRKCTFVVKRQSLIATVFCKGWFNPVFQGTRFVSFESQSLPDATQNTCKQLGTRNQDDKAEYFGEIPCVLSLEEVDGELVCPSGILRLYTAKAFAYLALFTSGRGLL